MEIHEAKILLYRKSQYSTYAEAIGVNGVSVFSSLYHYGTVNLLHGLCKLAELMEHQSSENDFRVRIIINENHHLAECYLSEAVDKVKLFLKNNI
jgi:hypothetical protein